MKMRTNFHTDNNKLQYHILSDEKMKEIGFDKNFYEGTDHEEYSPYWWFTKLIQFPKEKVWENVEIELEIRIPKDGSDLDIRILDLDFCQPYDYQRILKTTPGHKCANIVKEQVDEWIKYLQDNGVLF